MITHAELRMALACALAAAEVSESPDSSLQGVLFDFKPPMTLNLVGTNRQRVTVVRLDVQHGLQEPASFFMSAADCRELINALAANPGPPHRATLYLVCAQLMTVVGANVSTFTAAPFESYDYEALLLNKAAPLTPVMGFSYGYLVDALRSIESIIAHSVHLDTHTQRYLFLSPVIRRSWKQIVAVDIAIAPAHPATAAENAK